MRIIEEDELLETVVDGTTFIHTRLAVADHLRLMHEIEERGKVQDMRFDPCVVQLCLRGWKHLEGHGGRLVPSPHPEDRSPEAEAQRAYVLARLPYGHIAPLAARMTAPSVETVEKNFVPPSSGASSSPIDVPGANFPVETVDASAATTALPSLATVAA